MSVAQVAALATAAVACVIDLRTHRIPNWLTFGAALGAFGYHAWTAGAAGLGVGMGGWFVGFAFFFLPFALGGLGAGDVKLVAALGAWLGTGDALWLCLYTGVAGGVVALVASFARGYLGQLFRNVWLLLMHWRVSGVRSLPELTLDHGKGLRLAYGVSILAGTVVTVWLR